MRYSEDPALAAQGHPEAEDPRDRCPAVSDEAKTFLLEAENLSEALFDLCDVFRIPVTNNIPWFEDSNPDRPIYHVGEFIETVQDIFAHFGVVHPDGIRNPENPDPDGAVAARVAKVQEAFDARSSS